MEESTTWLADVLLRWPWCQEITFPPISQALSYRESSCRLVGEQNDFIFAAIEIQKVLISKFLHKVNLIPQGCPTRVRVLMLLAWRKPPAQKLLTDKLIPEACSSLKNGSMTRRKSTISNLALSLSQWRNYPKSCHLLSLDQNLHIFWLIPAPNSFSRRTGYSIESNAII